MCILAILLFTIFTMDVKRGALVVVEGCDRCGKTTQCELLVKKLNQFGIPAKCLKFPDRSTLIGGLINSYLTKCKSFSNPEIHLFFSINRWELVKAMEQDLNSGITLIVDRYSYSGIAYSASKDNMELEFCFSTEIGLPRPDVVVFLDGSVLTMAGREGFGGEIYEVVDFQAKVKEFYRHYFYPLMKVVNAEDTVEEVNRRLMEVVMETIDSFGNGSVERLTWTDIPLLDNEKMNRYQYIQDSLKSIVTILENSDPLISDQQKLVSLSGLVAAICSESAPKP